MSSPRRLLIEGWRGIAHSYALVNQFQILELLSRGGITIAFRDLPLEGLRCSRAVGLFSPEQEERIAALPAPAAGEEFDAVFRIGGKLDLRMSPLAPRTVVFSTAENGMIPAAFTFDNRPIARTLENNPVRIVTPSNWSRLGFLRSGASANRVVVVPHGIDPTIFSPLDESSRAEIRRGLRWDGVVFLTVGAATANKGVNLLLKAFAAVSRKHPRTHLYIKGINDLYESNVRVEETISNLSEDEKRQISGRAHFTGGLGPFTEMARLYRLADAYVCPYLSEGFCLPALEAAACGAPVICTEGGPTDDFVRDEFAMRIRSRMMTVPDCYGEPGWQLEPDLDHLIELMTRVVEQPEIRQRAHIAGPQFVHGNYTWRHAVDRLLPILFS